MQIARRQFLLGTAAIVAAQALPLAAQAGPLISGLRWQSWPIGEPHPPEYCVGTIGFGGGELRPRSYWLKHLERHRTSWGQVYIRENH